MIQKKLLWLLGYNNLSIILEQERKHWLMKTDNNKQIQNKNTGDVFHGKIDNLGSDVIIESKQLPYKYSFVNDIKFGLEGASNILEISKAAFPYSNGVNGLMFARVLSFHFPYKVNGVILGTTFHLKFEDAKECILPFGVSTSSNEVYADKWIKTTTPPKLLLINVASQYTTELPLLFENNVTNAVYYYPLSETLQPFGIDDKGDGIYEINAIDDDGYIDYDKMEEIALVELPNVLVAGASAYPRKIDFKMFREIADEVGAYLMVDMAHIAGLKDFF